MTCPDKPYATAINYSPQPLDWHQKIISQQSGPLSVNRGKSQRHIRVLDSRSGGHSATGGIVPVVENIKEEEEAVARSETTLLVNLTN